MPTRAIFRDPNGGGWRCIDQPTHVLVARDAGEVADVLRQVDELTQAGETAAGFVAYEAAGALDVALDPDGLGEPETGLPLALFITGLHISSIELAQPATVPLVLTPAIDAAGFAASIDRIKAYLRDGDTYQVNFTHRLSGDVTGDPVAILARLYEAQPSPYALLLQHDDFAVCSISPELFFERHGDSIRCEPMKGTRPRGRYPLEDQAHRQALTDSAKDRAENLMILDMIRNDLGRVARPGTVTVDALFSVRRLPTVWQQVSSVTARTDADLLALFQALFPCASVTGAPRARTMAIIRELETDPRGVYTGALGVVSPNQQARFSVGIRTLTLKGRADHFRASYGVGGGIVWDSDAAEEWQESLTKARVLQYHQPPFELLETMLFEAGAGITDVSLHLSRLAASADYFGFSIDEAAIRRQLAQIDADEDQRVRLLLDESGETRLELHPVPLVTGTVELRLAAQAVHSDNIFLFHKTTCRDVYEQARQSVTDACDDVILWNERGELTETTICNLILEIDGQWLTPHIDAGLLAGTCREALLRQGRLKEQRLQLADLERADRLFVCNSVRGVREAVLLKAAD